MPDDVKTITETMDLPVLYRVGEIVARQDEGEDGSEEDRRTFDVVFSTETRKVQRWYGTEILDHGRGAVDLEVLATDRAPLLVNHDPDIHIGVVEGARIVERQGRARIRFSTTEKAEEIRSQVMDGTRPNISVGYRTNRMVLEEDGDESDRVYRVVSWTPLEISSVPLGADLAAMVGRKDDQRQFATVIERRARSDEQERGDTMPPDAPTTPATPPATPPAELSEQELGRLRQSARDSEVSRVREINALAERHAMRELGDKLIGDGTSIEEARGLFLNAIGERGSDKPLTQVPSDLDLSAGDIKRYSLCRAILAQHDKNWSGAEFERECSEEIAKRLGRQPDGFFVPLDWQNQRDEATRRTREVLGKLVEQRVLQSGVATGAAELVATDHLGASFIELLRNMQVVRALGATVLSGLQGDVTIPKQTAAGTAAWVAETVAPSEGALTTGQVAMAPNTLTGFQEYSRKLLLQSDPSIDALVRTDLAQVLAIEFDRAAINGSGTGAEPEGILNTNGLAIVALGPNGAAPTWDAVVGLETEVDLSNALMNRLAYLGNARVRGELKITPKVANQPIYLMADNGQVNGYPSMMSQQVPNTLVKGASGAVCSALIFGNWGDLLLGEWGVMDMIVNPYVKDTQRVIRVSASMEADVDVRRIESFSAIVDMLTSR